MSEVPSMIVRGREFQVGLEVRGEGKTAAFTTELEGRTLRYDTWEGLYNGLMEETRKAAMRIAVRFTYNRGREVERGTVYGIHGGTQNPMVEWESGVKGQLDRLHVGFLRHLDDQEMEELRRLVDAQTEATAAVDAFMAPRKIVLKREIDAALQGEAGA